MADLTNIKIEPKSLGGAKKGNKVMVTSDQHFGSGLAEGVVFKGKGVFDKYPTWVKVKEQIAKLMTEQKKASIPVVMVDYQHDLHDFMGDIKIDPKHLEEMIHIANKIPYIYTPKFDGMKFSTTKTKATVKKPQVFSPLLPSPKSRWGKAIKKKLDDAKKTS